MKYQRGAALLLMFMIAFLIVASLALARPPANAALHGRMETRQLLARAKEALLAYAVTYEDNYSPSPDAAPGYFPCPNLDLPEKDEAPNPPCNSHFPILGRLPRLFDMRDSNRHEVIPAGNIHGEEFWYVLSKGFQNNYKPGTLNTTSRGRLTVDGHDDIVAVVIAPGAPLNGQVRPSVDPHDYLEGENADGDDAFTAHMSDSNDQLVFITRTELDTRLSARVAGDLKRWMDRQFDLSGTYPADLSPYVPGWFLHNWSPVTSYSTTGETARLRFAGCAITYTLTRAAPAPVRDKASCA